MMTAKRSYLVIGSGLLLAVVLGGAQLGRADGSGISERYGLKGLKGFYVQVDRLPFDVEQRGLTQQQVQRDVELRLRKGGAVVLTREQAMNDPNAPRLHVRILTSKVQHASLYTYCIVMNFGQAATLARDASISVDAVTWTKTGLGMIKSKKLEEVRKVIAEITDEFLNAYLSENPR
jgi:hypothetical protein